MIPRLTVKRVRRIKFGLRLSPRHHIDELQSLRGIAALVVAISHMSMAYPLPPAGRVGVDSVLNAHASIIVFFVLSGYVLTGSLLRRGLSWLNVRRFYVGRLFRLFPALWVASAFSAFFLILLPKQIIHPAVNAWFSWYLTPFPSATQLPLALLAIDRSLIMPVWTIFIELMGSAVVPLLLAIALLKRRLWIGIVLGLGSASYLLAFAPHRLNALSYLFDFALGVWLASRDWNIFSRQSVFRLVGSASLLVFFRFAYFSIHNGHVITTYVYDNPLCMLIEGLAAFFMIGELAAEGGRIRWLRNRWAVGLGNVSYSLYLIHFPVTIVMAKLLSHVYSNSTGVWTATAGLVLCALPASFGLSLLLYHFVEMPSIALGKKVTQRGIVHFAGVKEFS